VVSIRKVEQIVKEASGATHRKMQYRPRNPQGEFFLVKFDDEPEVTSALTTDTGKIQDDLTFTKCRGGSALWDAVYMALNEVKKGRNPRKALLVISDGGDNHSHYTEEEIENAARAAAVPIYAVGVYEAANTRARTPEELNGPTRLRHVADQSGAQYFTIESLNDIPAVVAKITADLRAPTTAVH
jgi:Ca-activated chloride channel homolog